MNISVKVKIGSRKGVEKADEGCYNVFITSSREKGRANEEILRSLADHFGKRPYQIRIISGHRSREKSIEIDQSFF